MAHYKIKMVIEENQISYQIIPSMGGSIVYWDTDRAQIERFLVELNAPYEKELKKQYPETENDTIS